MDLSFLNVKYIDTEQALAIKNFSLDASAPMVLTTDHEANQLQHGQSLMDMLGFAVEMEATLSSIGDSVKDMTLKSTELTNRVAESIITGNQEVRHGAQLAFGGLEQAHPHVALLVRQKIEIVKKNMLSRLNPPARRKR